MTVQREPWRGKRHLLHRHLPRPHYAPGTAGKADPTHLYEGSSPEGQSHSHLGEQQPQKTKWTERPGPRPRTPSPGPCLEVGSSQM